MAVTETILSPLAAYECLEDYARRHGWPAVELAMHAAVAESLRVDMVALLRRNFLAPEHAAGTDLDADLLFAPFCEHLGGSYFRLDAEVRRQLVDHLEEAHSDEGESRVKRVAAFLLAYANHLERRAYARQDRLLQAYLETQRWVAAAFLDPDGAAEQLAGSLEQATTAPGSGVGLRLGSLASVLSLPLARHRPLLDYAFGAAAMDEGDRAGAERLLGSLEDRPRGVGSHTLPAPSDLLGRAWPTIREAVTDSVNGAAPAGVGMRAEVDALLKALAESGCQGARERMSDLVAALQAPLDGALTRLVLDTLRSHRCFVAMQVFATEAAKVAQGNLLIYVKRQLAQAKIELGRLDEAITLLEALVPEVEKGGSPKERSEVTGLLGRAHKQSFVEAVEGGAKGDDELRAAVQAYSRVYDLDRAWHGANIVALVARAERDGIKVETEKAETWARRLLEALQETARPNWGPWDFASAGEAYLALGDKDNVADCFAHFWNMSNADGFALAGTERQLREIWQVTDKSADPLLRPLVVQLEARKLGAPRGGASGKAGATLGAESAIPLDRMLRLLDRAKSVCRIADLGDPDKAGTGFLVNGPDLSASLTGVYVLTNHHILHGPESDDALLASPAYAGSIDVAQAQAEFHYWEGQPKSRTIKLDKVVHFSPRSEADFALASLSETVSPDLALPLSHAPKPLGSRNVVDPKHRAKVIVLGHPRGGELSFSVSDNGVVDHELDDNSYDHPRRIHYHVPFAAAGSGSPVLHSETLDVVGLHRSGGVKPLRDDWPRARPDEVYEASEAVSIRSVLERLGT